MKKLFALSIVTIFLFSSASIAQDYFDQGLLEMGGSFSFNNSGGDAYEDSNGDGSTSISIAPSAGYFVIDNFSVGAVISLSKYGQGDYSSSTTTFGPVFEYFYDEMMGPGYVYGHLSYMIASNSWDNGTNTGDYSSSYIRIAPGYFVPLNDKVGVSAELYFSMDSIDGTGGSQIGLSVGFKLFK